ncbi:MAG: BBP7 family outer membrane beta-barrel protein [Thermoguttaceae bacterium]
MPINRTSSRIAIALLATFLAYPAFGQGPLGMQLFAPADTSTYGGGNPPNEGYFFAFDGLFWSIPAPRKALIGTTGYREVATNVIQHINGPQSQEPVTVTYAQTSTLHTDDLQAEFQAGQRFEFGRVEDNNGWLVSIFRLGPSSQKVSANNVDVLLGDEIDPNTGHGLLYGLIGRGILVSGTDSWIIGKWDNLPVTFDQATIHDKVDTWGVEASYLRRSHTFHNGGNVELFLGARYFEFNEVFIVHGYGGVLDDNTYWKTSGDNHIVGPQIGGRYFKQQGRWTFSTEGRFMAGFNMQNTVQQGEFGYLGSPNSIMKPEAWQGSAYSHRETVNEFSPLVELRVEAKYMITRAVTFKAGWTGFWVDGIARPNDMIVYQVPDMGISTANNRQSVFVNGVTVGFEINR